LGFLDFDEYCRFGTSALFGHMKRASIYMTKESRSIKTAVSGYSSKAKYANVRGVGTFCDTCSNLVHIFQYIFKNLAGHFLKD
jgi:hypothetical protein